MHQSLERSHAIERDGENAGGRVLQLQKLPQQRFLRQAKIRLAHLRNTRPKLKSDSPPFWGERSNARAADFLKTAGASGETESAEL